MSYPFKLSFKSETIPILFVVSSFVLGIYFYRHFPASVVSHWNFRGEPDGYSGKTGAALGIPFLLLGIYLLFLALPALDPKKDRYRDFAGPYAVFRAAIIAAMFIAYLSSGLYNLGYNVPVKFVIPIAVGLLMMVLGNFMGKLKNNWFVGIRTPWTLSSENVWNKTHRMGGYAFIFFGLLIIAAPFLPPALGLAAFIVGALTAVTGTFLYSYFIYRKEKVK